MSRSRPFQVDLQGVVDLLGRHIYSSPRVYLRELIQNGVDAITARQRYCEEEGEETEPAWGVIIYPTEKNQFVLVDEGIGLTFEEVSELLATVGRSSKRDILGMARTDYLGQFGIGLLSCFMVSDSIRIISQSVLGTPAIEWIGSGSGTFEVRTLDYHPPIGTQVFLTPRFDSVDLMSAKGVLQIAKEYGQYLPIPVCVSLIPYDPKRPFHSNTLGVNSDPVFMEDDPDFGRLEHFANRELGFAPLGIINLIAPGTGTRGKGFVLPYSPPPNAHQSTRVYLGGMMLSHRVDDLLPEWAFFVRAVVDSIGLSPTASREAIVEDFNLEYTREQMGSCVRGWVLDMAVHSPHRFARFLSIHEAAIKQLILHDEELAHIFMGWLSVETSSGRLAMDQLVRISPAVRYVRTRDEFQQISALARADSPLVNGGYVYDSELMELLPSVYPTVVVTRVDVLTELDRLDPPSLDDRVLTVPLEDRATKVLESRECQAVIRIMEKEDIPALFVADPEVFRHIDRGRAAQAAGGGLWQEILSQTDSFALSRSQYAESGFSARLCLNWANPLIRSLATLDDQAVFDRYIQLIYVQSQLAGSYPLTQADRRLMTTALSDLMHLTTTRRD